MEIPSYLQMDARDNVLVALIDLKKGSCIQINQTSLVLQDDVPAKHKFFISCLDSGDDVIMYGVLVGKARQMISPGKLMDVSNVSHAAQSYLYHSFQYQWKPPDVSAFADRTFRGYCRSDGR